MSRFTQIEKERKEFIDGKIILVAMEILKLLIMFGTL